MTIGANTPRVVLNCNGVSTVFPVNIQAYLATDFLVLATVVSTSVSTALVLNSDYTLTPSGTLSPTAWTLTTLSGQLVSPFAGTLNLQVILNPTQTQQSQYVQNQPFPSLAIQTNLDRLTQMVLRLQDQATRTPHAPDGDISPQMTIPVAAVRALQYAAYDAQGNATTVTALPGSALTQAIFNSFFGAVTFTGVADSPQNVKFTRNSSYAGGTVGFVTPCVSVYANVGAADTNYEWAFLSVLNNSAIGGQNVAVYGQGNRQVSGAGPTWGGVMEVREVVPVTNPASGLIGLEVDNRSNGTDAAFNRVGIDVVAARYDTGGAATVCSWGVRVQANNDANVTVTQGFAVWNAKVGVAFDCGNALSIISGSLRMPQGVPILFDISVTPQKLLSQGLGLDHIGTAGTLVNRLLNAGGLQVGTAQVVGPRSTGWTAMTGTPDQVTAFATSTVTLAQLAGRVMSLQAALTTHGLIGT